MASTAVALERSDVSRRTWLAYGLPAFALAGPFNYVQFYFLNFATDVLLLAPAAVGTLIAAARAWDAISDPMAGYLSDRTRTRWGRRRPWMFVAAPGLALAFVALWSPPSRLSGQALWLWIGAALLLLTTASTAWSIPHYALGAELSSAAATRRKLFALRFVSALSGVAAAFGGMQIVVNAADPRLRAAEVAGLAAVAIVAALLIPPLVLREREGPRLGGATHPFAALRDLGANRHARRLLFVWCLDQGGLATQGAVAPYLAIYVLQRPDLVGILPACFIVPMMLSVPLWIRGARRYGSRRTWTFALLGGALAYVPVFWLQADAFLWAAAALAFAGFFMGCGGPVGPALLAAAVDEDADRSGQRKEGVYFAAWTFVDKCGSALVVLTLGFSLQLAGFEPNVEQQPAADLVLRACVSLLPASLFLVAAFSLSRLRLGDLEPRLG
jgi:GPH family glycoside/pentoside/hexuronide:cation symporter